MFTVIFLRLEQQAKRMQQHDLYFWRSPPQNKAFSNENNWWFGFQVCTSTCSRSEVKIQDLHRFPQKTKPTFWWTDVIFWVVPTSCFEGAFVMFWKEIWWQQIENGRSRDGYWKPPCGTKKSSPFGLIPSIISNDVTVNGGLGSESSRNDPTFQVYEWLKCIEICPGPLLMFQSKALLEMRIWRVQLYKINSS